VRKALQADKNRRGMSATRSATAAAAEAAENTERRILAAEQLAAAAVRSAVAAEAAVEHLITVARHLETVATVPAVLRDFVGDYQTVHYAELLDDSAQGDGGALGGERKDEEEVDRMEDSD
jgi:hypothetical protein